MQPAVDSFYYIMDMAFSALTLLVGRREGHPTAQFFTGWMPFLPPKQQRQSTVSVIQQQQQRPFNGL